MIDIIRSIDTIVRLNKTRIKGLVSKVKDDRCVWKSAYNNNVMNDVQIETFEEIYHMNTKACLSCDGYQNKKECYINKT